MQVFDSSGMRLGYVTGTLNLHSDDRELRTAWEEMKQRRPKDDTDAEPWIAETLTKRGYRVT
jgi:hypothetical protein